MKSLPMVFAYIYHIPHNLVFSRFAVLFLPILCAVLVCWSPVAIHAQSQDGKDQQNWNDREIRTVPSANPAAVMMREMQTSLRNLPLKELSPAAQAKIKTVVSGAPLFHRMPQQTIYADPEICHFLTSHPDMVIGFWEQLGATQLSLREIKENHYILKESSGTAAAVEVLYRTNDLCIAFARGEYRGPLLSKAYYGNVLLVLRTRYTRDEANEPMLVSNLDTFVQINNLGADVLAKLFFASLTKVADSNFEVTMSFVSQVSRAASRNAEGLKNTAEEISSIRQEVCAEFCDVVDRVAMRYARRNQPTPRQLVPLTDTEQNHYASVIRENSGGFFTSSKPPAHWGMDHFTDFSLRFQGENEALDVPGALRPQSPGETLPRLPNPKR